MAVFCGNSQDACKKITIPTIKNLIPSIILNIKERNLEELLSQKKLHLTLDLDHTLIHATTLFSQMGTEVNVDDHEDVHKLFDMVVKLRPGVREFLDEASSMFDLSIYTMGTRNYAKAVLQLLDPEGFWFGRKNLNWRICAREDCTTPLQKSLNVVLSHERVVLIMDDKVEVWREKDRANVINIAPYCYNFLAGKFIKQEDDELARVLGILKEVHSRFFDPVCSSFHGDYGTRDVRPLLQGVMDELEDAEGRRPQETLFSSNNMSEAKAAYPRVLAPVQARMLVK